ncbi:hypothetical protein KC675_00875 [Candidatus Dojkabacteria bacterium]|uniref:Uncharacterized protein n=1 Tax=Candidatus Dojkabacteria bacterium TaxID=2099670 RepID=A0A955L0R7_9BACT|nr:hypothetical protein [Candidatus Dojkabacteria bacterium]
MIILIATKNIDKFNTTKGIFQKLGLIKYDYKNLRDYNLLDENEEVGSMKERAKDKVEFAIKSLKDNDDFENMFLVVGIDDGFYIPSKKLLTANSKEMVDDILSGNFLSKGDAVEEVRSYAIYSIPIDKYFYYESRLPLKFLGNDKGVKREEGINPLKNVLSFETESEPIGNHSQDEIDVVILRYVEKDFGEIIKQAIESS